MGVSLPLAMCFLTKGLRPRLFFWIFNALLTCFYKLKSLPANGKYGK